MLNVGFEINGQWLYKLADPFRIIHYLPIDAATLAMQLDLSHKTALRICKGERPLKKSELLLLQVLNFGLIPDKQFMRSKLYFYDGALRCHRVRNYELLAGELANIHTLKMQMLALQDELAQAKTLIKELQSEPEPSNIIRFADFKR